MAANEWSVRLDKWIWWLIYGGLAGVALGIASRPTTTHAGWVLIAAGAVVTVIGVALIFVRARLPDAPQAGAQSKADQGDNG